MANYSGRVERVVDGDTFVLERTKNHIRLRGVNTPELDGNPSGAGEMAKRALSNLLLNQSIQLRNIETQVEGRTSAGGTYPSRLVGIVLKGNQNINVEIVKQGWAVPTPEYMVDMPYEDAKALDTALKYARINKTGLWKDFPNNDVLRPFLSINEVGLDPIDRMFEYKYIPGATRIGTIWLYVPPNQITVTEHNSNVEFPTVRTPGSPRVRSTQQEQRIEIGCIFPNFWSVNYQLRPIIAQFMRSIVLPIENTHIKNLLLPSYLNNNTSISSQVGVKYQKNAEIAKDFFATQDTSIAQEIINQQKGSKQNVKPSSTKIDDRQLYVVLRNIVIATVPGTPEAIQATFTLTIFNYLPHVDKIEYLKTMPDVEYQLNYLQNLANMRWPDLVRNKPNPEISNVAKTTSDISESEPFKRYYRTLLSETKIGHTDGSISYGRGLMPRMSPMDHGNLRGFQFVLPTNELSNEQIATNIDEKTRLLTYIENIITDALKVNRVQDSLFADTIGQLGLSAKKFTGILLDFFSANPVSRSLSNLDVAISDPDSFTVRFGEYLKTRETEMLTSIREVRLSGKSSAKDVLQAAIGNVIKGTPEILRTMKRISEIDTQNIMGTKGEYTVNIIENNRTVVSGLSATYSPIVIPIPILGHLQPSVQCMGKTDWAISLNIITSDQDLVKRLMYMNQISRLSRLATEKAGVRWFMVKLSAAATPPGEKVNGIFQYLGIGHVLMEDFVCNNVPDKPGWFNISLRMVQSDLDITEHEKLVPVNQLAPGVIEQIKRHIRDNKIPTNTKTTKRLINSISATAKAAFETVGVSVADLLKSTFFNSPLIIEDLYEIVKDRALLGKLMDAAENPEQWQLAMRQIFDPEVPPPDDQSLPLLVKDSPWFLEQRAKVARHIFQRGVQAAILSAIATNPVEMLEIYDPTLIGTNANIDQQVSALKALMFRSPRSAISPLNGCYPDLELPVWAEDPLLVGPDFFYKKDDRIPGYALNYVRDRLDTQFQRATEILGRYGTVPGELIGHIRTYAIYKRLKEETGTSTLLSKLEASKATPEEIYDTLIKYVREKTTSADDPAAITRSLLSPPSDNEISEIIKDLNVVEYANLPPREIASMYRVYLAFKVASAQDMINKANQNVVGENTEDAQTQFAIDLIKKQRDTTLAEFNSIPRFQKENVLPDIWGTMTTSNIAANRQLLEKTAEWRIKRARSEEISGSLARIFPTVKLFFIEEDSKSWGLFDDYYDYNAIKDVRVVMSKTSASKVASVSISNITQRLTDDRKQTGEILSKDQTAEEQTLSTFVLREGMTIQIRAGYNNDPMLLEPLFIGKIVSVQPGDTIQIVAQSFGAELTSIVFGGEDKTIGYFGSAKSHGDVVLHAMNTIDGLDHFGNRSWLDILKLREPTFANPSFEGLAYSNPKYRKWDYFTSLINPLKTLANLGVYDPRLENVFLPYTGIVHGPVSTLAAAIGKGTLRGLNLKGLTQNKTFDWFVHGGTSMWDLLNEICLYHNDYIVTTLPYNDDIPGWTRETIYVGPRNGLYKYTERYDDEDIAKALFSKNKFSNGLPIGFINESTKNKRKYTIKKMASERGFENGTEIGTKQDTVGYYSSQITPFIATRDDAGQVRNVGFDARIGHYVVLQCTGNRSANFALDDNGQPIFTYTMIYGLENPTTIENDPTLADRIQWGNFVNIGDVIGYGRNVKQRFFRTKELAPQEWNQIAYMRWGGFDMVGANVELNVEGVLNGNKQELHPDNIEASKYVVNVKNPDHILDDEKKPLPGYTPVVQYHWIDSMHDIIENNIQASAAMLHNKVTVRFPKEPGEKVEQEFSVVADDNIKPGNIRELITTQENIDPAPLEDYIQQNKEILAGIGNVIRSIGTGIITGTFRGATQGIRGAKTITASISQLPSKYTVSSNILAREMRKMYTGEIKIWGRPSIRPHSIVYINDMTNQMFGPIEVADVVHEFSPDGGFITTIVPEAVVNIRDQARIYHDLAMQGLIIPYLNKNFQDTLPYVMAVADPIGLAVGGAAQATIGRLATETARTARKLGVGATQAVKKATALNNVARGMKLGTKVAQMGIGISKATLALAPQAVAIAAMSTLWSKGVAKVMGRDIINIVGLFYNGVPFTAGMEGAYKDTYTAHFEGWVSDMFSFSAAENTWSSSSTRSLLE